MFSHKAFKETLFLPSNLQGHEDEPSARKRLIILGEDSKAPSRGKKKKISSMDELKPVFNYCKFAIHRCNKT